MSSGFRFRRRKTTQPANYLDLTPEHVIGFETDKNGHVLLLLPRFSSFFWRWVFSSSAHSPFIRLSLDKPGSETWKLIDGKNTVRDICRILEHDLGDSISPVEERVTQFLTRLYRNQYIRFTDYPRR